MRTEMCPVLACETRLGGGRRNLGKMSLRLDVRLRQSAHQSSGKKMAPLAEPLLLDKSGPCFTPVLVPGSALPSSQMHVGWISWTCPSPMVKAYFQAQDTREQNQHLRLK